MFSIIGHDIEANRLTEKREDLSFIVRFEWKTSNHLKEAIQVFLSARIDAATGGTSTGKHLRRRSEVLDDAEFHRLRIQIASNPDTPSSVLTYLARWAIHEDVLERIAENANCPDNLLAELAWSGFPSVRAAVAENPSTPDVVLESLVEDPNPDVRYRLAENANLPECYLEKLCQDEHPYVSYRANQTVRKVSGGVVVNGKFEKKSVVEKFAATN